MPSLIKANESGARASAPDSFALIRVTEKHIGWLASETLFSGNIKKADGA